MAWSYELRISSWVSLSVCVQGTVVEEIGRLKNVNQVPNHNGNPNKERCVHSDPGDMTNSDDLTAIARWVINQSFLKSANLFANQIIWIKFRQVDKFRLFNSRFGIAQSATSLPIAENDSCEGETGFVPSDAVHWARTYTHIHTPTHTLTHTETDRHGAKQWRSLD